MFAGNPQGLQQRYAMSQDLLDLLALQKLKKDKEAAQRDLQMQMQAPAATVKDQLAGQVMDMTKQEVTSSLAPGIQQQGQAMQAQQLQQAMGGIASQPAPNMVGMARGGIVGYQEGGGPVGEGVTFPEPVPIGDGTTPEYQPEEPSMMEDVMSWVKENPADAASLAMMAVPGIGWGAGLATKGAIGAARVAAPLVRKYGPKVLSTLQRAVTKPNPRMVRGEGFTMRPAGEATRVFSPGRASFSAGAGSYGLGALLGGEEEASAGVPVAVEPDAPPAGGPEVSSVEQMYQGTDEDLASMTGTDLTPMRTTQPEAPQDKRISRYEEQLARLEAEEKDKLGSLIEFLLAAGASGGTNLGATLTGGGSGLRARDARIEDEIAKTIQNIETLELRQSEMAQQDRQFSQGQEFTRGENQRDRESREREAGLAANAAIARAQFEFDRYADETERKLNSQAAELTMQDPEFITARKKIMEQYAGGLFSDANPAQAQADISALYSGYFSQKKRQLTGMGMSGAGGFSGEYVTP